LLGLHYSLTWSLERVFDKKFSPIIDDTLFLSGLLNGVREVKYHSRDTRIPYRFVGIQRLDFASRRKWLHQFWDFTTIVFFACVEEYVMVAVLLCFA
jgi:hypothetical protein